jgi:hypothetical protein
MKRWKVETPNNTTALRKTLEMLTAEGWNVEYVMQAGTGIAVGRRFTVVASRPGG